MKSSSSAPVRILLASSITGSAFFCGLATTFFSTVFSAAGLSFSTVGLLGFSFFSADGCCAGAVFSVVSGVFSATTGFASTLLEATCFVSSTSFLSVVSEFLRGRPTLRLGVTAFSALVSTAGVSFSLFVVSSLGVCCAFAVAASFVFVTSPVFVAETTLSSFLAGVTRERFFFSSLRSSLSLSAATFLVAPTIACSSSIL